MSNGRPKGSKNTRKHNWQKEEIKYIESICKGKSYKEITKLVNEKFGLDLIDNQIKGLMNRYHIVTGLTGQFKKGCVPFNKGMKGYCAKGSEKGWFKKGHSPQNHKPVGSERIDAKDGYVIVKTQEPNTWEHKHKYLWKKYHNQEIPKGSVVIFGDGDKRNFSKYNLILVTRSQLLKLNQLKLIKNDADLTRVGINIVDLLSKIKEKEKDI